MVLEGVVKHISTSVQFTSVFASTSATPCSNIHTCNAQDVLKSVGGRGGAGEGIPEDQPGERKMISAVEGYEQTYHIHISPLVQGR